MSMTPLALFASLVALSVIVSVPEPPGMGFGLTVKVAPPRGLPCASRFWIRSLPQLLRSIGNGSTVSLSCELLTSPPARVRMLPAERPGHAVWMPSSARSMEASANSKLGIV